METIDFSKLGEELVPSELRRETAPMYKGQVIYRDMADNLTKIYFDVTVTEGYNPNVHWSLLGYDTDPQGPQYFKKMYKIPVTPIFNPSPNEIDMPCHAKLSGSFIIDAIVTGQPLSFDHPEDMKILENWIEQYLKSYQNVDLTKFPDRKAFNENAKKALNIMRGNIVQMDNYQQRAHPSPLTLAEIIANL